MTKFTKEEINLCKQVAEKHRKKIIFGVWFHDLEDPEHLPFLWCNLTDELKRKSAVPLWTISDCLEFFKKREHTYERSYQLGGIYTVHFISEKGTIKGGGATLLAACLKAVLVVIEEEK